jgi:probable HAF family extracellular repeat protein
MIGLGYLPGGGGWSTAYDINNACQVVGESDSARALWEAFIWDPVSGMRDLGVLPNGSFAMTGYAINELGQVTGQAATPNTTRPFLWDSQNGLEILEPYGGRWATAYGINDHGVVVGEGRFRPGGPDWEGIIGDRQHGLRLLTDLLDAATFNNYGEVARAYDINNAGEIVGRMWGTYEAVLLMPFVLGDMNCDGEVNGADIDPFFAALAAPVPSEDAVVDCHPEWAGDVNQDGHFNGADIDPFFDLLGGGCP